ncbi:MAG TPA: endonuclease V [Nitrososphaeraceae archaeon]|nr:endonuclease V [Nitrososphaeraceae archaeon]
MKVCLDVDYRNDDASVAAIVFDDWESDSIVEQHTVLVNGVHPYVPGEFYKRELPCLLAILKKVQSPIDLIVVDSYVWLATGVSGMGHHLYEALNSKTPVIGCAKTHFGTDDLSIAITRGQSKTPLFITSVGVDDKLAAGYISKMHGVNRVPTLLKKVDQLCRTAKY